MISPKKIYKKLAAIVKVHNIPLMTGKSQQYLRQWDEYTKLVNIFVVHTLYLLRRQ